MMQGSGEEQLPDEVAALASDVADQARTYLAALRGAADGDAAAAALPLLLLAVSNAQATGARLGAMADVVPAEQFETDAGPEPDPDDLRSGLAHVLGNLDDYVDPVDPLWTVQVARGSLGNDLTAIAADLHHGLRHYDAGRATEALWWWQFSFISSWGERCAAASRVLLALIAHSRLNADAEVVMEAELEALYGRGAGSA